MTDTTIRYVLVEMEFPADVDVDTPLDTYDGQRLSPVGMVTDVIKTALITAPWLVSLTAEQVYPGDVVAPEVDGEAVFSHVSTEGYEFAPDGPGDPMPFKRVTS